MRRTAVLVLLGALVVGCAADGEPAAPAPTTTAAVTTTTLSEAEREERAAAAAEAKEFVKKMNRTPSSSLTSSPSVGERDFDNCVLFNETILAISEDYYSGQTDAHTGLASARIALSAMKGLDCGRFSPTIARAMADMDRALRAVGY